MHDIAEPTDPLPKVWDPNIRVGDMLRGRRGLVVGIANEQSIAFGCAAKLHAFGAELAVTYLNEKAERYVRPLAEQIGGEWRAAQLLGGRPRQEPAPLFRRLGRRGVARGAAVGPRRRPSRFDGANLVMNFEAMNPGNTWWSKYYNVFANVDTEAPRFIGFERWWSTFYFMNESEIRWIIENLFIGNKLQRGEAVLGGRSPVDLKRIKAPIIVFASQGDDITPPPQALNWIPALYDDEREIRARGQRIVYMVHKDIGHLGIFVSAKVARKEHDRIVPTLEMVEALAPGLYEMRIEKKVGEGTDAAYTMACDERTIADIRALDDGQTDEKPFALVARLSRFWVDGYELTARPFVKAMVTPAFAEAMVLAHPLRMRRYLLSDRNPAMRPVAALAESVRAARKPVAPGNPFFF